MAPNISDLLTTLSVNKLTGNWRSYRKKQNTDKLSGLWALDALKKIDETSKWLIGRIDSYLVKVADKSGRRDVSCSEVGVITIEATRF